MATFREILKSPRRDLKIRTGKASAASNESYDDKKTKLGRNSMEDHVSKYTDPTA
jgi:hypothetical protein